MLGFPPGFVFTLVGVADAARRVGSLRPLSMEARAGIDSVDAIGSAGIMQELMRSNASDDEHRCLLRACASRFGKPPRDARSPRCRDVRVEGMR